MFLGIDGCRTGWVAAFINNNNKIDISIYKNINGLFERKNIITKFIPDLDFILDSALAKYNQSQTNIDDFLDCLALAISAKLAFKSGNISKIPIAEQIDSKCFIMV